MRPVVFYLTAALALTGVACAKSNIYPVSGRVTHKGVPATGAAVFFYRRGGDPMKEHLIMGLVKEDGAFELVCGSLGKGAPPGEYDVLIEWKQVSSQSRGGAHDGSDKLKGQYADPKHPLLQATVEEKTNNLPPFELTDTGRLPRQHPAPASRLEASRRRMLKKS